MEKLKRIKILEEELQELNYERNVLHKKEDNIKLEYQVLNNKEQEIKEEIDKIKLDGRNSYLGKFAKITSFSKPYYVYITSVDASDSYSLLSFGGVGFCLENNYVILDFTPSCNSICSIKDYSQIELITKEEFLDAFDKFQQYIKNRIMFSIDAVPYRKTKYEWRFDKPIDER